MTATPLGWCGYNISAKPTHALKLRERLFCRFNRISPISLQQANASNYLRGCVNDYLMSYCFSFLRNVPRFNPKTIDALL